jgi:hypothetical protein
MFKNGELFAWHLYAETIPIFEQRPFLSSLGRPNPYTDGVQDVQSFHKILKGIPDQVNENQYNAIYETGLIYVCVRNIAMAASWALCDKPDFSRYSPFHLRYVRESPISLDSYEITMACRMAAQRGLEPPLGVDAEFALRMYGQLDPWIDEISLNLHQEGSIG